MEDILDKIYQILTVYGLKVLAALAVFIIGRWVAKGVKKVVERLMTKGKVDPTLISFTANLAYIGLLAFIVIAALGQLGIQTTSFIAILGAAGLAVGLALQGSLVQFCRRLPADHLQAFQGGRSHRRCRCVRCGGGHPDFHHPAENCR